jgi:hypothetical protein
MKKAFFMIVCSITITLSYAQVTVPAGVPKDASAVLKNFTKPPAIGDIGKTTSGITDALMSQLQLPGTQKSGISDAVGSFLKSKSGIMDLAGKNPTDYLAKFNPLQSGLFSKLKGIMGAAKFASFLKLKPAGAGNILSNLFF